MELTIYQVDAFSDRIFGGNPAAVCPLEKWMDERLMLQIAEENNLSETVFFVEKGHHFEIRWFMPHAEINLCGHATLAAAYIIFHFLRPQATRVDFLSKSGPLSAAKTVDDYITLDFPSWPPNPISIPPSVLHAFQHIPTEALASRDLILRFESEQQIREVQPNLPLLRHLPYVCIAATAPGEQVDFVSRVFDANASIPEDPVTGSTHASLIPYWQERLHKSSFTALQLSKRGGLLLCRIEDNRVFISGKAVLYLQGVLYLPH